MTQVIPLTETTIPFTEISKLKLKLGFGGKFSFRHGLR